MADELELDFNEDNNEEITRKDNRIKSLSEKYKTSEMEKAELAKAREEDAKARQAAEQELGFFKDFSKVSSKYQGASDYQDQILEKHKLGLSVEESTMLVLAKEGKFQGTPTPPPQREMAAGGSASTGIADASDKPFKERSSDELRAALEDQISKGEFKL
jgi:hypothetical protein